MHLGSSIAVMVAAGGLAVSANAQLLYSNGNLADLRTGTIARNGISFAPAGGEWSEVSDNTIDTRDNVAGSTMLNNSFRQLTADRNALRHA